MYYEPDELRTQLVPIILAQLTVRDIGTLVAQGSITGTDIDDHVNNLKLKEVPVVGGHSVRGQWQKQFMAEIGYWGNASGLEKLTSDLLLILIKRKKYKTLGYLLRKNMISL